MKSFLKRDLPWIVLFGTLVGLNETIIGNASFPFRSVALNALSLALLGIARLGLPKPGTSLLIVVTALFYKTSSCGLASCTGNAFFCGPLALLLLGLSWEAASLAFLHRVEMKSKLHALRQLVPALLLAAILAFGLFALFQHFVLGAWNAGRMMEYALLKGFLTGLVSLPLVLVWVWLVRDSQRHFPPWPVKGFSGVGSAVFVMALWVAGWLAG